MKKQGNTLFHVEIKEKKEHHYFGSIAAIFDKLSVADIGVGARDLYLFDIEHEKPYSNHLVIIRKSNFSRKRGGGRGKKQKPSRTPQKVDCFTPSGEYLRTYDSVKDICLELNCVSSGIYHMINGGARYNNIKGFVFKKHPEPNKITKKIVINSRYI